ncbi:hypothetical protein MSG28_015471 [Choristoneura fumiferana]|uniref:Uncharacterized protein n=1 Tax=Choristoneura fumiferana TaxID=7141 RepID=A0ACC0KAU7_CHOFU|nr:hypothetical protein MSG28_015471 [Choristoneura fumiferana]
MDFVKREEQAVIDDEHYKTYLENHAISMEQLHQAMQTSINTTIAHNFQLPLSPRQISTLMLKTNHFNRNFNEIPPTYKGICQRLTWYKI